MLTVKHIDADGLEHVYEAERVSFHPRKTTDNAHLEIVTPSPAFGRLTLRESAGTFYVMNEAGKTIAKYTLGARNETSRAADAAAQRLAMADARPAA
ncbi:MAG: hypothetical protein ACM31O_03755 [Bacteroidota bacterium]